jgi:AcrR family transcriptional regulator
MPLEDSKKNRIMEYAFQKFASMGTLHVTMEEISRGVGIGKGTLYKYFPSKESLLLETINYISSRMEKVIEKVLEDGTLNPVEKLSVVLKTIGERLSKINPSMLAYMERSIPEAFEKIEAIRQRIILTNIIKLFEEGKKSGHFEPDMDTYLVAHIIIGAANHVTEARVLSTLDYGLEKLIGNLVFTILRGCLTEEGRKTVFKKDI